MNIIRRVSTVILSILLVFNLTACQGDVESMYTKTDEVTNVVKIDMVDGGSIVMELYPDKAPITVKNFQDLVGEGFYDGLTFHRIVEHFVVQGGDPLGTGTGGPGHHIYGEFASNGFPQNDLKHEEGSVAMARSMMPDSAGSQFYICLEPQPGLDGQYAVFGKVIEGMETVHQVAKDFLAGEYSGNPQMEAVYFAEAGNN